MHQRAGDKETEAQGRRDKLAASRTGSKLSTHDALPGAFSEPFHTILTPSAVLPCVKVHPLLTCFVPCKLLSGGCLMTPIHSPIFSLNINLS